MLSIVPRKRDGTAPLRELRNVTCVTELIGNTPLVQIKSVTCGLPPGVRVLAKLEGFNPGGSVKDRPAWNMVRGAIASGQLRPGKTIIDSTSGNTGIALAMIGAAAGYPVHLVVPSNVSEERKRIIRAYGAQMIFSDPLEGSDGAIRLCRELVEVNPEKYFKPDQYFNPLNSDAHYETTGPEIYSETEGSVTHLIAGIGTGGTIMGSGRYLKEQNPRVRVIAVEPDDAMHGLEGLKHMATSIVPGIFHEEELDGKVAVSTEDAYAMVYRLSQEEGLLVGQSSGAAMHAALEIARSLTHGVLVTIFPDFGGRYLTTNLWIGWQAQMEVGEGHFSI